MAPREFNENGYTFYLENLHKICSKYKIVHIKFVLCCFLYIFINDAILLKFNK